MSNISNCTKSLLGQRSPNLILSELEPEAQANQGLVDTLLVPQQSLQPTGLPKGFWCNYLEI